MDVKKNIKSYFQCLGPCNFFCTLTNHFSSGTLSDSLKHYTKQKKTLHNTVYTRYTFQLLILFNHIDPVLSNGSRVKAQVG